MAFIQCSSCGKHTSDLAPVCSWCQTPLNSRLETADQPAATSLSDFKPCPFCAEPIKTQAVLCRHCGSGLNSSAKQGKSSWTGPNIGLHLLPWGGVVLLYAWVSNTPLIFANRNFSLVIALVVLGSAVLMAMDAANLAMGSRPNPKTGKTEEGPIHWLIAALLLWLAAYPIYMFRRARYSFANQPWACLAGATLFLVLSLRIGLAIDAAHSHWQTESQKLQQQIDRQIEDSTRQLEALQQQLNP